MSDAQTFFLDACVGYPLTIDLADHTIDPGAVTDWELLTLDAGLVIRDVADGNSVVAATPHTLASSVISVLAASVGVFAGNAWRILPDNDIEKFAISGVGCPCGPCTDRTWETLIGATP